MLGGNLGLEAVQAGSILRIANILLLID